MARMHTRKKGKSGSHRNRYTAKPSWVKSTNEEITDAIVQMRKSNLTASQIGIKLRDQYAIPSTKSYMGKKLSDILEEKSQKTEVPDDLNSLIQRYKRVNEHLRLNNRDKSNMRGRSLIMSKILRLVRYYKKTEVLPQNWNLDKVL